MDSVPHIALPIAVKGDAFATVEQDTNAEVANAVAAIVSFPLTYRPEAPDFGIDDPTFGTRPLDTSGIALACEQYEPRASLRFAEAPLDPRDPLATTVQIEVFVLQSEDE